MSERPPPEPPPLVSRSAMQATGRIDPPKGCMVSKTVVTENCVLAQPLPVPSDEQLCSECFVGIYGK